MALTMAATFYLYEYVVLGAFWDETHSGDSSCLKSVPDGVCRCQMSSRGLLGDPNAYFNFPGIGEHRFVPSRILPN
jgi:hypothetical protein